MDDLAEQLIKANEAEKKIETEKDELGLPLPQKKTPEAKYNYLAARALFINKHIYTRNNKTELWNEHEKIKPKRSDISKLARWYGPLPPEGVVYVYEKLKQVAPYLDETKIAITPTMLWDIENQELIETDEPVNVITDWD